MFFIAWRRRTSCRARSSSALRVVSNAPASPSLASARARWTSSAAVSSSATIAPPFTRSPTCTCTMFTGPSMRVEMLPDWVATNLPITGTVWIRGSVRTASTRTIEASSVCARVGAPALNVIKIHSGVEITNVVFFTYRPAVERSSQLLLGCTRPSKGLPFPDLSILVF